jgi:hypothetical protein
MPLKWERTPLAAGSSENWRTAIPSPPPTPHEQVPLEDGEFVNLLVLDIDSYAEKYGEKAIRRNVTIPAWLNTYGNEHNVNFSRVLQDALLTMAQN